MPVRKVYIGQAAGRNPLLSSAASINAVVDAANFYQQQMQLGRGIPLPGLPSFNPAIVQVKNDTGDNLPRGALVQLHDYLLDPIDTRYLWFSAEAWDNDIVPKLAILREPILEDAIGPAQISGMALARVNVGDTVHGWAIPVAGETIMDSGNGGLYPIISTLEEDGEQDVLIMLSPSAGDARYIPFRNDSGETAPAYGVLEPTGVTVVDGRAVITIQKPSDDPTELYFANGPGDVEDGESGFCTMDWPAYVLYDTAVTPAANTALGVKEDEWKLFRGRGGFQVLGDAADDKILVGPGAHAGYAALYGNGGTFTAGGSFALFTHPSTAPFSGFDATPDQTNHKLTVNRKGAYMVHFDLSCRFTSHSGASPDFWLAKNGSVVTGYLGRTELNNANARHVGFHMPITAAAGDEFTIVYNGVLQELTLAFSHFSMHRIGPTWT